MRKIFSMAAITAVTLIVLLVWHFAAHAHDHSRPELNSWFEGLKSGKGLCCSGADGTALSDADWDVRDGHYRVRIQRQWWDVPEQAVIKEPNRAGRTMVWPVYDWTLGKPLRIDILCFMVHHTATVLSASSSTSISSTNFCWRCSNRISSS